jgi:hypothetical protein
MEVFQEKLKELSGAEGLGSNDKHPLTAIIKKWEIISALGCKDEVNLSIQTREAVHDAIDEIDVYLLGLKQNELLGVLVAHLNEVIQVLEDDYSPLSTIFLANKKEALLSFYFYEIRPAVIGNLDQNGRPLTREQKEQRNNIWISLVFRMLCWFLLHDFNEVDVKIVPSNLKGSRMAVYIS